MLFLYKFFNVKLMNTTSFQKRHIGPNKTDEKQMLKSIGLNSLDELINETIPEDIRLKSSLNLDAPMSEYEYLNHIEELSKKNKVFKSYIGLGYHEAIVPSVIKRNILENPSSLFLSATHKWTFIDVSENSSLSEESQIKFKLCTFRIRI